MGEIYVLENIINGKIYIGQSIVSAESRWYKHKTSKYPIGRAIRKYGWKNFKNYTYYVPDHLLNFFEIEMIKKADCLTPNGYNILKGGSGARGIVPWNKGKKGCFSEETIKKMSESSKGIKSSDKTKRKISKALMGNTHTLGNKQSKKTIEKRNKKVRKIVRCIETNIIYESLKKAAETVGLKNPTGISGVCKGKSKTAGGYHWEYV